MTEQTTVQHDSKAILQEALDTIKATFWISGKEFSFAQPMDMTWDNDKNEYVGDWSNWDSVNKAILADLDQNGDWDSGTISNPEADNKVKVTGVCSVGALALANVTLYDEPLQSWDAVSDRDWHTLKAGAALLMEIVKDDSYKGFTGSIGEGIANWNDYHGRTREQVVECFARAVASPLAASDEMWELKYRHENSSWDYSGCRWFASEQAATDWLASDDSEYYRTRLIESRGEPLVYSTVLHANPALIGA